MNCFSQLIADSLLQNTSAFCAITEPFKVSKNFFTQLEHSLLSCHIVSKQDFEIARNSADPR